MKTLYLDSREGRCCLLKPCCSARCSLSHRRCCAGSLCNYPGWRACLESSNPFFFRWVQTQPEDKHPKETHLSQAPQVPVVRWMRHYCPELNCTCQYDEKDKQDFLRLAVLKDFVYTLFSHPPSPDDCTGRGAEYELTSNQYTLASNVNPLIWICC